MMTYFRIFSMIAATAFTSSSFAKETVHPKPPVSIYGAEIGKAGDPRCRDDQGQCLILQGEPVVLKDYSYKANPKDKPEINFSVSKDAVKELAELSKKYMGSKLAVLVDETIIAAPKVRAVTDSNGFMVSFCDHKSFEVVMSALGGKPGATDSLKAFKGTGC